MGRPAADCQRSGIIENGKVKTCFLHHAVLGIKGLLDKVQRN
jgi:hypothetical protein